MKKSALVTGSSRGIGRGIAIALSAAGYHVGVNYNGNETAARETVELCRQAAAKAGVEIETRICKADVAQRADRDFLVKFMLENFGRIDLLVNNAGISTVERGDLLDLSEESFDLLFGVNLKGPFFLSQTVARLMVKQTGVHEDGGDKETERVEEGQLRPMIINIGSISAYAVSTNRGDYCLTKAGMGMLTLLFADRLAEYGIHVYEIRPGIIRSDMTRGVIEKYDKLIADGLTPIRRWGTPEDVAKAVVALASDVLPFTTGEVINVDGGFHIRRL